MRDGASDPVTRRLLGCGVAAAPVFLGVLAVQAVVRPGWSPLTHPISLLARGDLGWMQVGSFVVTGLLVVAGAVGSGRALAGGNRSGEGDGFGDGDTHGPGTAAAPALLALSGAGLIGAGVFVTDPGFQFPPGDAPAAGMTAVGLAHSLATGVALNAGLGAAVVLARRWWRTGRRGWAIYSLVTALTAAALGWWRGPELVAVRLAGVATVLLVWVSATSLRLLRDVR